MGTSTYTCVYAADIQSLVYLTAALFMRFWFASETRFAPIFALCRSCCHERGCAHRIIYCIGYSISVSLIFRGALSQFSDSAASSFVIMVLLWFTSDYYLSYTPHASVMRSMIRNMCLVRTISVSAAFDALYKRSDKLRVIIHHEDFVFNVTTRIVFWICDHVCN